MSNDRPTRPYSRLPEVYALVALAVWIDVVSAAWPGAPDGSLATCALLAGALLSGAAAHSWYVARPFVWERDRSALPVTLFWLLIAGGASLFVESHSGWTMVGLLAYLQVAVCSFVVGHRTLRLALASALVTMLAVTWRMPLYAAGSAWVLFAVVSVFVLSYDRTARLAGPAGFARGERRHLGTRVGAASAVALASAFLFAVTPIVGSLDLGFDGSAFLPESTGPVTGEQAEADGLGYGLSERTSATASARSDVVIMTLETYPAVKGPLYVRGRSFDAFDGKTWGVSPGRAATPVELVGGETELAHAVAAPASDTREIVNETFRMLVSLPNVIFAAGRPVSVVIPRDYSGLESMTVSADGVMLTDGVLKAGSVYKVKSAFDEFDWARLPKYQSASLAPELAADLQMPAALYQDRVRRTALDATRSAVSPYEKARAIETYLRSNYTYSLKHDVGGPQVVNEFLYGADRKGHCALFASAMVMMCRSINLPARYVTGFLAQNPSAEGFTIRGSDGHAWVDVYIDGAGWISFDPTSPTLTPGEEKRRERPGRPNQPPPHAREDIAGLYGRDEMPRGGGPGERNDGADAPGQPAGPGGAGLGGMNDNSRADGGGGRPGGTPGGGAAGGAPGTPGAGDAAGSQGSGPPRVVRAPGGGTDLPRYVEPGTDLEKAAEAYRPQDPAKQESDWRWLIATLSAAGLLGLGAMVFWRRAVQPALDREIVREALPAQVEEDPDARRFVVKLYHTMVSGFGKIGLTRRDADTPGEFAAAVAAREPSLEPSVGELTALFEAARYDREPVTAEQAARARAVWGRIARAVERVRPRQGDGAE